MGIQKTLPQWCKDVAGLSADMMVGHGLIQKEDVDRATKIIAEEILVRLSLGDYPPLGTPPSVA